MAKFMRLGPVFEFEWLAVSRRWQWYFARSVFALAMLVMLAVVWWGRSARASVQSVQGQAEVGRQVCGAILATQLAMVLLIAPAATAGSICLDRARGTLLHMLMTDLSACEIVVGKLAARMVPVIGTLLCFLPIPALASLFGGIDLSIVAGSVLVTLGAAVVGCAAALALSTWGTKTHEVLLATYAAWSLWLLVLPIRWGYRLVLGTAPPPEWLHKANPIWLVGASVLSPGAVNLGDQIAFFGASVLAAAALTALAASQVRTVAIGDQSAVSSVSRRSSSVRMLGKIFGMMPGPSLDANPVLWRE